MAQIINVHPGQGELDDRITVDLQYDPTANGVSPNVSQVVFSDNVDAPQFNVTDRDTARRTMRIVVRVPADAVTGRIAVDLDGVPPISTVQNFTVTRQKQGPMSVARIQPPVGPYQRGTRMVITLSGVRISQQARVYFPRTDYGPANLQAVGAVFNDHPARCTVNSIPQQTADHGRVKIVGGPDAVYTRVLTFS